MHWSNSAYFFSPFSPLTSIFNILLSNSTLSSVWGCTCGWDEALPAIPCLTDCAEESPAPLKCCMVSFSVCLVALHCGCAPHFIHSSIDEPLDNFYFLAVVKSITNTEVRMSLREADFISYRYYVLSGNSGFFEESTYYFSEWRQQITLLQAVIAPPQVLEIVSSVIFRYFKWLIN